MMRKTLSRLLALVLVLCMVMVYVPIQAQAVDLTRPDGLTDEQWEALRQKLLAQLAQEQATEAPPATPETLPETDSLSKTETGELVVTDTAKDSGGADTDQSVSVELPVKGDEIKTTEVGEGDSKKTETTNEFDTTIKVEGNKTDISVTESYDLEATVETTSDGEQVTDVEYNISLDAAISAEKKPETSDENAEESSADNTVVESTVIEDLDKEVNSAAAANKKPAAQYKVNMTVNGMKDDPTRVEHKYTTKKDGSDEEEVVTEYYYNADNGIDENDTQKKYFTVTEVKEATETEGGGIVETVKEKVVSLWTSFLGIFHITNDAFENQTTKEMSSDLGTAVNGAKDKETVELLRDYTTDEAAVITTDKDVTVDLNEHTYSYTEKEVKKDNAAIRVDGSNQSLTIRDGYIDSDNRGIRVNGNENNVTIDNVAIDYADVGVGDWGESNTITVKDSAIVAKEDADGDFGIYHNGSKGGANISVVGSYVYANNDTSVGIYVSGNKNLSKKNTLTIKDSDVLGETGVEVKFTDVTIHDGYLVGFGEPGKYKENGNGSTTVGAALAVTDNKDGVTGGTITINSGWFYGSKDIENIYLAAKKEANDPQATIAIYGGRFANAAGLTKYTAKNRATISHNDGSTYLYEVVTKDYIPTRDGYRFLGYTDSKGNAITLADAIKKGVIAYAQWKELPETTKTASPLIIVKTDERGCTTKYTIKGDTIYATVKDADGEFAPISEVTIPSVKRLQEREIDTVEIRVDEDVTLVLDVEKAKENGFTDVIEVTLEEDVLLITSGKKTCIELNIAELKASDKPVEIQLVEGELTIKLGKNSALTVDLTKALETGERIVVKLENGVLKLYDKYNKPIETEED